MLILNLLSNIYLFIGFIVALAIAISVHEAAHAWMSNKLGDSTAKQQGRISLNPLAHLDLLGTVFLFLVGLGWGKPVPVNYHNLSHPKIDGLKIALAGPVSNLFTAIIFALILRFIPLNEILASITFIIVQLNLVLMIFNLIPIPPLDGSNILAGIVPDEVYESIRQLSTPLLLIFLIFAFTTNYISNFISMVTQFFLKILVGI